MTEKTVREELTRIIQADGYDFFTAAEHADKIIREVTALPPGTTTTYHTRGYAVTLQSGR